MCSLLQDGFIQTDGCTDAGADENGKVAAQNALIDGGNGVVLIESSIGKGMRLRVDEVSQQALCDVEDKRVKLQLRICPGGGSSS